MKKIEFQEKFKQLKSKLKDYKNRMIIVKLMLLEFRAKLMDLKMMI